MRVAVVGHVEWVEFARVERLPAPGEITHALDDWQDAGGGGAVAALQLAALAGGATLYTALGDDEFGRRAARRLEERGVRVVIAWREERQRRAFTFVDASAERTITLLGRKLTPRGDDDLPWHELADTDAVYFTARDAGALSHARRARVLVATARELPTLVEGGVRLDALVCSGTDVDERYAEGALAAPPDLVVTTAGATGGTYAVRGGGRGSYAAARPAGTVWDSYGAGDCFAGGLSFALARGDSVEAALRLAACCGAAALTGPGVHVGSAR